MKTICVISVFVIFSVTQLVYGGTLNISTNKQVYAPGEQITISITGYGPPSPIDFGSTCQTGYIMDGTYNSEDQVFGCLQIYFEIYLPHTWQRIHNWSEYSPGIGTHHVTAYLEYPWTWYFTSNTAVFSVAVPQPFHVISPNGGEQRVAGSTTIIQWYNYESGYLYDLAYSTDNENWLPIASSVSGSSYAWAVPGNIDSSQCLIKVSKLASPVVTDVSDGPFAILPPFHVISPNGGEHFVAGSIAALQWQDYENEFLYDLKYSADGGQNWQSIVSSITGYSHSWAIPNGIHSDQCLVKVIKLADPNVDDSSNTMFTIFECQNPINMDFNHDCYVSYPDYNILSNNWQRSDCTQANQWCDGTDIYQDGLVGIQDLMLFVEQWLKCDNPFDPAC